MTSSQRLPGKYARPSGVVLIARDGDEAAGAIAYRMVEPGVCRDEAALRAAGVAR